MASFRQQHGRPIYKLSFALTSVLNSLWIFYIYLSIAPIGSYEPANFSKILEGTADRPFIYRILIPLISRIFSPFIPRNVEKWIENALPPIKIALERLGGSMYLREAIVVVIVMFLSLVGFAFVERKFIQALGMPEKIQFALPLFAQALILPFTYHFGFYYDLPQVLLVTTSLLYLFRGNWMAYLIIFAVTTLNKETAVCLIFVYAIYYFPLLPRRQFIKLLFDQAAIYAVIRIILIFLYRNNPGDTIPSKIGTQLYIYSEFPIILLITLIGFGTIFFYIIKRWNHTHLFLRCSLIIFAIIFVLFFTSGIPMEFRVFLDALPTLAIWVFPFKLATNSSFPSPSSN